MADLNEKLSTAVEEGKEEGLKLCINEGADKDYKDEYGRTPLMIAAENGHLAIVKYLISIFCNKEARNNNGRTPLMIAAGNGHLEVVRYLVSIGCKTDAASENGKTALHFAAELGCLEVIKFLVESEGVNLLVRTNEGATPYHLAAKKGGCFGRSPHSTVMTYLQGLTTYDFRAESFRAQQKNRYEHEVMSFRRRNELSYALNRNRYKTQEAMSLMLKQRRECETQKAMSVLPEQRRKYETQKAMSVLPQQRRKYEMDNFTRIAMVVFIPLTDVLYDRLKLDRQDVPSRKNVDIPYLYSKHKELSIHLPSRSKNRPSGQWGGTWQNISTTDTAIGDDIERIRLIWDELRYSEKQQLDDKRYKELFDIMHDLFERFDQHNKPTQLYSDSLTKIIPKNSFVVEERNTFNESKRNIETEAAIPTDMRITDDKYSAHLYHTLLESVSDKDDRLKLTVHTTTSDEEEHNTLSIEEEKITPREIDCNRKTGTLLTTGIYCDGYFIDCDVHHSLIGSYRLFRKTWKGEIPVSKCMKLESMIEFENLLVASTYLNIEQGGLSFLTEKSFLQAVDKSQDLLCRLMLSYIDDSETTLEYLSKVLKYAMSRRDVSISVAIAWRLTWTYFTKFKSVLPTLIDIWPAYRCTCTSESENDICSSDAVIVVQLDTEVAQPSAIFFSIQVIYSTNVIDHKIPLANKTLPCPDDITISGYSAETLFDNHRNLTLICKSSFVTSQNQREPSNTKLKLQSCVKLFCKGKGFIPIGEKHFPKTLCGMPTKIVQGTPTLMTGMQIGNKIGTDNFKKGTLGGFVRFRGEDAFLTCFHVFLTAEQLTADYITLDDNESYTVKYYPNTTEASKKDDGFICGTIKGFGFGKNSEGTSIDAALIQLEKEIPIDSSHFNTTTGLQSCYLNDVCIDYNSLRHGFPGPTISIVSIGSVSGISNIEFNCMVQKPVDIDIDAFNKSFNEIIFEGMRDHVVAVIQALHSWSDISIPLHDRMDTSINNVCGTEMLNETKASIAEIVRRIFPETLKEENCAQKEKIDKLLHEVTLEQTSSKFSAIFSDVHMQTTALTMTVESAKRKSYRVYKQIYIPGIPFQMGDSGKCLYVHDRVNQNTKGCIGMAIATHPNGGCIATPILEILKYFQIRFKDCS